MEQKATSLRRGKEEERARWALQKRRVPKPNVRVARVVMKAAQLSLNQGLMGHGESFPVGRQLQSSYGSTQVGSFSYVGLGESLPVERQR